DFATRVFELTSKERYDHDGLVQDELVFTERPRKGVVACWPNEIHVSMDPEHGSVNAYSARDDRVESSDAPKVTRDEARAAVVARIGSRVKPEVRAFLAERAPVELVAVRGGGGAPRTTWLVAGVFGVDALTRAIGVAGSGTSTAR